METTVVEGKVDWRAPFGFDNFATIVLALNLATYFNQVMHFDIATTSNMLTNFMGTSCNLAVVIACFADTHVARYKVAIVSAFVEFLGNGLLGIQAHNPRLKPPVCNIFNSTSHCEKVKGGNAALLYIMLYSIALGKAGVKASVPPYEADQFDENDPQETPKCSFFSWVLHSTCIGGAFSMTGVCMDHSQSRMGLGIQHLCTRNPLVFTAGVTEIGFRPLVEPIP